MGDAHIGIILERRAIPLFHRVGDGFDVSGAKRQVVGDRRGGVGGQRDCRGGVAAGGGKAQRSCRELQICLNVKTFARVVLQCLVDDVLHLLLRKKLKFAGVRFSCYRQPVYG